MKKRFLLCSVAVALCAGNILTSCEDDPAPVNGGGEDPVESSYVIAANSGSASYLLTAESLEEGTITADKNNGNEQETGTYWVFHGTDYFFRLVYNQGGDSSGASYILNSNNSVQEDKNYSFRRVTTYGVWGDNVITSSTGDTDVKDGNNNAAQGFLVNYLSATNGTVTTATYQGENYLGNGEFVSFSGFVEANGKLYTSVIPMGMSLYGIAAHPDKVTDQDLVAKTGGGSNSSTYVAGTIPSTQYPDDAYIAIYSGNTFDETPVIISTESIEGTNKIGYATGRNRSQYYQTFWAADNGDLYVFSPGYGRLTTSDDNLKRVQGQLPSGVMRIKAGATEFDPDYYVNIEELGDKFPMYRCWHITGTYFLLQMYTQGLDSRGQNTTALAVFNGENRTLQPVTGLPARDVISAFGGNPFCENGHIYMPVSVTSGAKPTLYKINPQTAVATPGLVIDAESVAAVGKLNVKQ